MFRIVCLQTDKHNEHKYLVNMQVTHSFAQSNNNNCISICMYIIYAYVTYVVAVTVVVMNSIYAAASLLNPLTYPAPNGLTAFQTSFVSFIFSIFVCMYAFCCVPLCE